MNDDEHKETISNLENHRDVEEKPKKIRGLSSSFKPLKENEEQLNNSEERNKIININKNSKFNKPKVINPISNLYINEKNISYDYKTFSEKEDLSSKDDNISYKKKKQFKKLSKI